MKYRLHLILAGFLSLTVLTLKAQTVSDFENLSLPGDDTTYLESQFPNGSNNYSFESGNVRYWGNVDVESWGATWANFNYSNETDTATVGATNQGSNITGSGFDNSSQFGIAFISLDWMGADPTATIPVGAGLTGDATGGIVAGCYITNATYTYHYMTDNDYYANGHYWLKLIVRGYNAGAQNADSVVFTLADYSDTNHYIVNTWQWINLASLGNVDSLTFDMASNDTTGGWGINTPAYFAIDNLVTLDNNCPATANITVSDITGNSATVNWENSSPLNIAFEYEIAIDQSPSLAPTATPIAANGTIYNATSLDAATLYYAHIRTKCSNDSHSSWDTASFTTLEGTGILHVNNTNSISVSPNPATGILNLNVQHPVDIAVYDISGKQVANLKSTTLIDVSGLASGLYMLKISDNKTKQTGTAKFVKE